MYFIIQILPFLPLGLEDRLSRGHLGDLFSLLHQLGLLDPEYHVAPVKNRRKFSERARVQGSYSQKLHLMKSVMNLKPY